MNIVIAADKKYNKIFDDCIKNENHNLLGYETEMRANFIKRISDHYNPHILIIVHGVKSKNFDFISSVRQLKEACPTLRVIYYFGRITEINEREYLDIVETLSKYEIFDILPYDLYERGFRTKFLELIDNPMTAESLQNLMNERQEEEQRTDIFYQEFEKIIDNTPVYLDKENIEKKYSNDNIITVDEPPEYLTEQQSEHITIAIGTISEKQAGCTLTAFEMTETLLQLKQSTALFLDEYTYNNYINYHGVDEASQGCEINGITLYPLNMYADKRLTVKFSVCDYGFAQINRDSPKYDDFADAAIKICICSFNEWDIAVLADYLNSPLPYIKEVNYIFFPVSQANFVKFSKQMTKGHCKSYRIRNSPDYTQVCDWNKNVYFEILSRYIRLEQPKKRFGLF